VHHQIGGDDFICCVAAGGRERRNPSRLIRQLLWTALIVL
jgi:hypothetical protein